MRAPALILASRSPQRRALLAQVGVAHQVVPSSFAEDERGADPAGLALANAIGKAREVAGGRDPSVVVLGADTVVALDGHSIGGPGDAAAARRMIAALAGRSHEVISGVCVVCGDRERSAIERTEVRIRTLSEAEIDWYVATGEWEGRAGGYAIQAAGCALVAGICGDYTNVVGLPVPLTLRLLAEVGRGVVPWKSPHAS